MAVLSTLDQLIGLLTLTGAWLHGVSGLYLAILFGHTCVEEVELCICQAQVEEINTFSYIYLILLSIYHKLVRCIDTGKTLKFSVASALQPNACH